MADMLDVPTLFVFQAFGPETAASFLGITGSLIPASGRNQDIYDTIKDILGDSVMLSSHVVKSARYPDDAGAELLVKHANGSFTIVQAERLVIAIQPTLSNLEAFDVDETESAVFSQPTWSDVHTGIVSNPALPDDGFINNLPADAAGGNNYALPAPPYMDYFGVITNLFNPSLKLPRTTTDPVAVTIVHGPRPLASHRRRLRSLQYIRSAIPHSRISPKPCRRRHDPASQRHQSRHSRLV